LSEDTYRVLTAVDAAVMVIDAANGVEAQTLRLLEVCRARNTPIVTFVNKMDRVGASYERTIETIIERRNCFCCDYCFGLGLFLC